MENNTIVFSDGKLVLPSIKDVKGNLHERIDMRHAIKTTEQFLQEHPMMEKESFECDEDEDELVLECFWCGSPIDNGKIFCSEKCSRNWVKD